MMKMFVVLFHGCCVSEVLHVKHLCIKIKQCSECAVRIVLFCQRYCANHLRWTVQSNRWKQRQE